MNKIKVSFSARSINESFARMVIAAFMSGFNPTIEQLTDVKTAVSEAVTNSIIHGYDNDPDKDVILEAEGNDESIVVKIIDQGKGIANVEEAVQPFFTTKPEQERSGLGFTVMQNFMDEFSVHSDKNGTIVTMKKILDAGEMNND